MTHLTKSLPVHAHAALIGKLLRIAINTVPQLSHSMSSLTRYMCKVTPAHATYARVVLRYLIGIKKRQLTCVQRGVADGYLCLISKAKFWPVSTPAGQTTGIISAVPWLTICSSTMRHFHAMLPSRRSLHSALPKPTMMMI